MPIIKRTTTDTEGQTTPYLLIDGTIVENLSREIGDPTFKLDTGDQIVTITDVDHLHALWPDCKGGSRYYRPQIGHRIVFAAEAEPEEYEGHTLYYVFRSCGGNGRELRVGTDTLLTTANPDW